MVTGLLSCFEGSECCAIFICLWSFTIVIVLSVLKVVCALSGLIFWGDCCFGVVWLVLIIGPRICWCLFSGPFECPFDISAWSLKGSPKATISSCKTPVPWFNLHFWALTNCPTKKPAFQPETLFLIRLHPNPHFPLFPDFLHLSNYLLEDGCRRLREDHLNFCSNPWTFHQNRKGFLCLIPLLCDYDCSGKIFTTIVWKIF